MNRGTHLDALQWHVAGVMRSLPCEGLTQRVKVPSAICVRWAWQCRITLKHWRLLPMHKSLLELQMFKL